VSVLKNKRGLSKLEFYNTARQLRKEITAYLLRNFGVKPKNPKNGQQKIAEPNKTAVPNDDEDEEGAILGEFPEWALAEFRRNIMQILRNLMMNITAANSIYPSAMEDPKTPNAPKLPAEYIKRVQYDELADRRRYQTIAIANCHQLIQELQYFTDVFSMRFDTFKVSVDKILPFIDKLQFEIRLLKGWRKSTNDLAKKILKGELKGKVLESE
jgi:hypothetical protein